LLKFKGFVASVPRLLKLIVDVYGVEYVRHKHLTKTFMPLNMFGINI
jgi:hypothetical protein